MQSNDSEDANDGIADEARGLPFYKLYRAFNSDQIEDFPKAFYPAVCPVPGHTPSAPVPYLQAFFDAIDIATVFGLTKASYNPPVEKCSCQASSASRTR